jgi:hypothetical protein
MEKNILTLNLTLTNNTCASYSQNQQINDIAELFSFKKEFIIKHKQALGVNNCGIFLIADNQS